MKRDIQNDSGISLSPQLTETPLFSSKVSVDAGEYVAFCLQRLWCPQSFKAEPRAKPLRMEVFEYPNVVYGGGHWYPVLVEKLRNILAQLQLPTPIIFMALLYIGRLRTLISFELNESPNLHLFYQLLVAALVVSQKQNSDFKISNKRLCEIVGYSLKEMNSLERGFLRDMRWSLHVSDSQYSKWLLLLKNIGKEHRLVMKAAVMQEAELYSFSKSLTSRPDIMKEIQFFREFKT